MTSSNGNIFRVTGHLCGEFTGPRSPVNSTHKGQWGGALMFPLICVWINGWVNNCEADDLRRYRAHYDVIVMHAQNRSHLNFFRQHKICLHFVASLNIEKRVSLNIKMSSYLYRIPNVSIRRFHNRLIFMMEFFLSRKTVFILRRRRSLKSLPMDDNDLFITGIFRL